MDLIYLDRLFNAIKNSWKIILTPYYILMWSLNKDKHFLNKYYWKIYKAGAEPYDFLSIQKLRKRGINSVSDIKKKFYGMYKLIHKREKFKDYPQNTFGRLIYEHFKDVVNPEDLIKPIESDPKVSFRTYMFKENTEYVKAYFFYRTLLHDLLHPITGYGTTEEGEILLFAWQSSQLPTGGDIAILLAAPMFMENSKKGFIQIYSESWKNYKLGKKANLDAILDANFSDLVHEDIDVLRKRFNIQTL